jgi:putative transposase
MVLACAGGEPNSAVAERLRVTQATVGKWRKRFVEHRLSGLYDELRPGKPRTIDDERVAELIRKTLHTSPLTAPLIGACARSRPKPGSPAPAFTDTSSSSACSRTAARAFKLSTDAFFIEKLRDVVGSVLESA